MDAIDKRTRMIKHALNCFNTETVLEGIRFSKSNKVDVSKEGIYILDRDMQKYV